MLDFVESPGVTALRARLRALVGELVPNGFLGAFTDDPADFAVTERFARELGKRQLLTMAWPTEFGGSGADVWEQTAVREEMWSAHEPRGAQYMGLNWVGPIIMRYGTEVQKAKYLPEIAAGEVVWCQGFSEPEAGSDLPALRTHAKKVDGGWVVNGQKVWTSYAGMAQRCFLLARINEPAARKDGITVFLVDMSTPGVEVRPIRAMLGPHHLNEVYFTDVFVPDDGLLGEVGGGWGLVLEVLRFERIGIARYARSEKLLREAPESLGPLWDEAPVSLRERRVLALIHARQARLLAYRVLAHAGDATPDPADGAAYRIAVTGVDQESGEVLMELVGNAGLAACADSPDFARAVEDHWCYSHAATVASGTLEIHKQSLARELAR